ncbi:MAG: cytochrome C [Acidobacteria bacterium]|nr:cytochrome C [Acidobacteriota bacterium]
MKKPSLLLLLILSIAAIVANQHAGFAAPCVDCHKVSNPSIVSDHQLSKHGKAGFKCSVCHGDQHSSASDVANAKIPTPDTCAVCHDERVKQYKAGKHGFAWAAMKAMPTMHWQPSVLIDEMKGCGGCHKIGMKTDEEIKALRKTSPGFGIASCDACHTRHTFSAEEARQPQACQTCHMGFDHPQWEMYSSSKHGVRYMLKQNKVLPPDTAAPTCQNCHMQNGNHEVRTAWGFLAVRLPMPDDIIWKQDRTTILQALGVLDPAGNATKRLDVVKGAQLARLTQEDWQKERDKMSATCKQCHSANFVKSELGKGDRIIKDADHAIAEAIRIVAGLYKDKILAKPQNYNYDFPDLLTFNDAPTPIEQRLFKMFLEQRNRTFMGTFHNSPDYAWWYGWSAMQESLTEIKFMAEDMRRAAGKAPAKAAAK